LMAPKHPYTRLLRESIPDADPKRRWKSAVTLTELEHEEYLRQGCKFAGRCPEVMEICRSVPPEDIVIGDVLVKCHNYTDNKPSTNY
jgi:peptide/nickel transport system ATP-binding protein